MSEQVTLPVSGVTVTIQRPQVSFAALMMDLTRAYPRPEPPSQKVDMGGRATYERNYVHPDYVRAVASWEQQLNTMAAQVVIEEGTSVELDEAAREAVAALRSKPHLPLAALSDEEVWLHYHAIRSDEDFKHLVERIKGLAQPTEGAINGHIQRFQANAQ